MMAIEKNKLKVIGVPMDLGSQRMGVDMGPNALRYAGLINNLRQTGFKVWDEGNLPVPTPESLKSGRKNLKYHDAIASVSKNLAGIVEQSFRDDMLPIVLGGDHSIAIGSLAGLAAVHNDDVGVVWIDAHPDTNTPESTLSGNIHGMSMAIALGHGDQELVDCHFSGPKLSSDNVCLLGTKDFDPAEEAFVAEKKISVFTMDYINELGFKNAFKQMKRRFANLKGIYVSLDLDVIDCSFAPGVGIRSHGGLTYREVKYLCKSLAKTFNIIGMEIVEFNPIFDRDNQTANLAIELVFAMLGCEYGDYQRYLDQQLR